MSLVPLTTQIKPYLNDTQSSDPYGSKIVLIYTDKMTEHQIFNMKNCHNVLHPTLECYIRYIHELDNVPPGTKRFVLPYMREELHEKVSKKFGRTRICVSKAIIELNAHRIKLPNRSLVINLSMIECYIFLAKSCDSNNFREKINRMHGYMISSFYDPQLNVVVTNRADNKYCARASTKGIPVVSLDWVEDTYKIAISDDMAYLHHNAMSTVENYKIKPFYGLYFKIQVRNLSLQLKTLITENQGHIVYGDQPITTHIVDYEYVDPTIGHSPTNNRFDSRSTPKIKVVNEDFLHTCAKFGYYLTNKEYQEHIVLYSKVIIKSGTPHKSQLSSEKEENYTPPNGDYSLMNDSFDSFDDSIAAKVPSSTSVNHITPSMLPPPPITTPRSHRKHKHKQNKQQDSESDLILRALNTFDVAQTQCASTQMRRLPDHQLKIEETIEPSQQLYWKEDDYDRKRR